MLMPAFGGGLTWCAHLVRFGARTTPIDSADVELPPCGETALDLVNALRARKVNRARSQAGLASPVFPETQVILAGANAVA
jgi:3-oxoacyl-[acyl-carrier-protein] synthase-3